MIRSEKWNEQNRMLRYFFANLFARDGRFFSPKVIFFFSHHFLSLDGGKGGHASVSLHIITENVSERNINHAIAAFDLTNTVAAKKSWPASCQNMKIENQRMKIFENLGCQKPTSQGPRPHATGGGVPPWLHVPRCSHWSTPPPKGSGLCVSGSDATCAPSQVRSSAARHALPLKSIQAPHSSRARTKERQKRREFCQLLIVAV